MPQTVPQYELIPDVIITVKQREVTVGVLGRGLMENDSSVFKNAHNFTWPRNKQLITTLLLNVALPVISRDVNPFLSKHRGKTLK